MDVRFGKKLKKSGSRLIFFGSVKTRRRISQHIVHQVFADIKANKINHQRRDYGHGIESDVHQRRDCTDQCSQRACGQDAQQRMQSRRNAGLRCNCCASNTGDVKDAFNTKADLATGKHDTDGCTGKQQRNRLFHHIAKPAYGGQRTG